MKALLLFLLISSAWELRFGSERRIAAGVQSHEQASEIKTTYDSTKDKTTVSLPRVKVSGAKEKYISLHVAASFSYSGHTPVTPEFVNFEIHSVVKARKLDPDLYVVLLLDGETIFLSSNRSAVRNPVPCKPWPRAFRAGFTFSRNGLRKKAGARY